MRSFEGRHEYKKDINKFTSHEVKRKIIPEEWKEDIDKLLNQDLLSANRYFAEENPNIARHVLRASRKDPETFYRELVERWDWHNEYFERLLEPALEYMVEDRHIALSPRQIEWLKVAYRVSSRVDQATLINTAAIKKHLDFWMQTEYIGDLTQDERRMLGTPPVDSFMAEYEKEHLAYIIACRENAKNIGTLRKLLIERYHAGDEKIFLGRMEQFKKYEKTSIKDLQERMSVLTTKREYEINHFYLTLERPRLRALRDTIAFDNREEYYLLRSLIGVSGFVLRKRVLQYLDESKILPNKGNIYEFSDETILEALEKLKGYRENLMRKKVEGFAQSADTCASAAYMMAMHALLGTPLSTEEEHRLHEQAQSRMIPGAFFSALAVEGVKNGAAVTLLHSEEEMFKRGNFDPATFSKLLDEYKMHARVAERQGALIKSGIEFSEEKVKDFLRNNQLLVIAGTMGGFLHAIVAIGYSPEGIIVRDPLNPVPQVWRTGRLDRYMKTAIGQWMMVIGRKEEVIGAYLKQSKNFEGEAESYLSPDVVDEKRK